MKRSDDEGRAAGEAGRERLALEQAALVAALAGSAPPPAGFDSARTEAAAAGLRHKRRESAARAWPGLSEALGGRYAAAFDAYAADVPLPPGGSAADARAFATWIDRRGELPPTAWFELFRDRLRQGWPARAGRCQGTVAIGVRLPFAGVRCWKIGSVRDTIPTR
ncbi:MAG: hypothetical protein JWO31_1102 [Phycisphaerales bacterium]|nr:hypothetical protein [Phycisphaerales bacterium]